MKYAEEYPDIKMGTVNRYC